MASLFDLHRKLSLGCVQFLFESDKTELNKVDQDSANYSVKIIQ
jgi:hypothetical protein